MNKLQKIRKEIERRKAINSGGKDSEYMRGVMACYSEVLAIFDFDFGEESVSEDLEEACDSYYEETWDEHGGRAMVVDGCHDIWFPSQATDDFFKAGAEWQKQQIIKRLCNHANIDQMVEKFEDKYKPQKVLDTEYYKRGIFDIIKTIKED